MIELFLNDGEENILERMRFPAGETFFKVKPEVVHLPNYSIRRFTIKWMYENDAEIFEVANLLDYLFETFEASIDVQCPYFPHARQDRYSGVGQPHSLKTMVKIFERFKDRTTFYVQDIHNNAASVIMDVDPECDFIVNVCSPKNPLQPDNYDFVICPDKGALSRANLFANKYRLKVIVCEKTRDPSTGKLSDPKVILYGQSLEGKKLLVVDDVCDGGGTFEMLGKELKKFNPARLDLYVTHGIFSRDLEAMPSIDNFYASYRMPGWRTLEVPEGKDFDVFCTPKGINTEKTVYPWGDGKWPNIERKN